MRILAAADIHGMARVYDWLEVQTRRPFLLQIHGHVHSAFGRSG